MVNMVNTGASPVEPCLLQCSSPAPPCMTQCRPSPRCTPCLTCSRRPWHALASRMGCSSTWRHWQRWPRSQRMSTCLQVRVKVVERRTTFLCAMHCTWHTSSALSGIRSISHSSTAMHHRSQIQLLPLHPAAPAARVVAQTWRCWRPPHTLERGQAATTTPPCLGTFSFRTCGEQTSTHHIDNTTWGAYRRGPCHLAS